MITTFCLKPERDIDWWFLPGSDYSMSKESCYQILDHYLVVKFGLNIVFQEKGQIIMPWVCTQYLIVHWKTIITTV